MAENRSQFTRQPYVRVKGTSKSDFSSKQFYFAKRGAAEGEWLIAGANEEHAIVMNNPGVDDEAQLHVSGNARITLGATLNSYASVTSDANGKAVAASTETASCVIFRGGVDGDVVPCFIDRHYVP